MVLKTTFGQSQRWSLIRGTQGVENEETNNLNFANKVFNRQAVLILGGLKSGISLYMRSYKALLTNAFSPVTKASQFEPVLRELSYSIISYPECLYFVYKAKLLKFSLSEEHEMTLGNVSLYSEVIKNRNSR